MDTPAVPHARTGALPSCGAVVLSGGAAARMGGVDKAGLEIGGMTLLEHALAALEGVPEVVVVGPEVTTSRPVTFTREEPAGGGPASGLLAGIRAFPAAPQLVVVLAVDMPRITRSTVRRLREAVADQGAVLFDGRRQHLCAVYDTSALLEAAPPPADQPGLSMRRLVAPLRLAEIPAVGGEGRDVDSWQDLRDLSSDGLP